MKTHVLILTAVLAAFASVEAQITPPFQPKDEPEPPKPSAPVGEMSSVKGFWQVRLAGGEYAVSTERITSVSRHSYVLDGTLLVDEVTIDTTGQALARFYFLSPIGANNSVGGTAGAVMERGKGILDAAGQRTGVETDNMVIKKYPDTTHAKTIEYRLTTQAELTNLFNSAKQAWQSGQGGQYTAPLK
ncbi:hypothetical protein OVA24_02070 [Luteolibacter sp. SL250]|uniref:hypothetical protein n=1 Tax=Luteolibacter sp. SL250 TaxID=2995170 RepID=UPI0022708D2A|nr:hypothetical protein [Luteolibacter sp. SL250]WAC20164.1 hypothetical protein OVA24_02070 [Luteolibacter sp. SL250]